MSTLKLLAALGLTTLATVAAVPAFAGGADPAPLTRAEVIAEFQRARAAGELDFNGYESAQWFRKATPSTLTRADVIAEYQRARVAGELDNEHNFHTPAYAAMGSKLTRAEVIAELQRARAAGELGSVEAGFGSPAQRRAMQ